MPIWKLYKHIAYISYIYVYKSIHAQGDINWVKVKLYIQYILYNSLIVIIKQEQSHLINAQLETQRNFRILFSLLSYKPLFLSLRLRCESKFGFSKLGSTYLMMLLITGSVKNDFQIFNSDRSLSEQMIRVFILLSSITLQLSPTPIRNNSISVILLLVLQLNTIWQCDYISPSWY